MSCTAMGGDDCLLASQLITDPTTERPELLGSMLEDCVQRDWEYVFNSM